MSACGSQPPPETWNTPVQRVAKRGWSDMGSSGVAPGVLEPSAVDDTDFLTPAVVVPAVGDPPTSTNLYVRNTRASSAERGAQ